MENKNQYNQPGTIGEVSVVKSKQVKTRTPVDIKISQLEEQLVQQHRELSKLRRDIGRLKDQLSEIAQAVNHRG